MKVSRLGQTRPDQVLRERDNFEEDGVNGMCVLMLFAVWNVHFQCLCHHFHAGRDDFANCRCVQIIKCSVAQLTAVFTHCDVISSPPGWNLHIVFIHVYIYGLTSGLVGEGGCGHRGDVHSGQLRPAHQVQLLRGFQEWEKLIWQKRTNKQTVLSLLFFPTSWDLFAFSYWVIITSDVQNFSLGSAYKGSAARVLKPW